MAVNVSNGRIGWTYPFNVREALAAIHSLLGEPLRTVNGQACYDVGTVCKSPRINPYSLIRPTYTTNPRLGEDQLKIHVPKQGYNRGYGWKVPSIVSINGSDLLPLAGQYWEHANPECNGSDFAILNHFNGYEHNARPVHFFHIDQCTAGKKILVSFNPTPRGLDARPAADATTIFNGWIMGCALFTGSTFRGKVESTHVIGEVTEVNPPATRSAILPGMLAPEVMDFDGLIAAGNTTYTFVPFVRYGNNYECYSVDISAEFKASASRTTAYIPMSWIGFVSYNIDWTHQFDQGRVSVTLTFKNSGDNRLGLQNIVYYYAYYYGESQGYGSINQVSVGSPYIDGDTVYTTDVVTWLSTYGVTGVYMYCEYTVPKTTGGTTRVPGYTQYFDLATHQVSPPPGGGPTSGGGSTGPVISPDLPGGPSIST